MRNPIKELISLLRRLRSGVPWNCDKVAYVYVPILALAVAGGSGLVVAGAFGRLSPLWYFSPWALFFFWVPALSGFYFTYLHDLLKVRLGWRSVEVIIQSLLCAAVFSAAAPTVYGMLSGILASVTAWVVAVRLAADLLPLRPDRRSRVALPGALANLAKHYAYLALLLCVLTGVLSRFYGAATSRWGGIAAVIGAMLCIVAALVQLGWVRFLLEKGQWPPEEVLVSDSLLQTWWRQSGLLVAAASFVSLLLPANISPLAYVSFDTLFRRFNTFVSPFFVKEGPVDSGTDAILGQRLAAGLEDPSALGLRNNPLSWLMMLVFVFLSLWILRRFLAMMGVGPKERHPSWERERGLWRLLWQSLLGWWRRITGLLLDGEMARTVFDANPLLSRAEGRAGGRKMRQRAPSEPAAFIRFYYMRFLERVAQRGWHRQSDETAAEFKERLLQQLPAEHGHAAAAMTQIYEQVRYGQIKADQSLVDRFRHSVAQVFKQMRRLKDDAAAKMKIN